MGRAREHSLFDLDEDPSEDHNLAGSAGRVRRRGAPARRARVRRRADGAVRAPRSPLALRAARPRRVDGVPAVDRRDRRTRGGRPAPTTASATAPARAGGAERDRVASGLCNHPGARRRARLRSPGTPRTLRSDRRGRRRHPRGQSARPARGARATGAVGCRERGDEQGPRSRPGRWANACRASCRGWRTTARSRESTTCG